MLKGRLGLEKARIPYVDRHGLIWLSRGSLIARSGSLSFKRKQSNGVSAGSDEMPDGEYAIPFQALSMILLGPGSTVSHDALRLLARHGTALVAVGESGVRCYTAPPIMADRSGIARKQVRLWSDMENRLVVAREMYQIRMGKSVKRYSLDELRGIEGARVREAYNLRAKQVGIQWYGRRYDRQNPSSADIPNQAINHAATALEAAAAIAVTAVSAIPQLGFIHESSGSAFILDIADLHRESVTIPVAFRAARKVLQSKGRLSIEKVTRKDCGYALRKQQIIPKMIDNIKELLGGTESKEVGLE
ncbi:MAG: type I-E CRISPR-associated endonuclease Cas1 [Rhodothermaceae bacterium]|nr:type I-E CRISPR-associated endonuclease Cas1 [Rhodothermaceae bacterium]MXW31798.1 type I-E CRISPR-associated endonuclease Cas1 [Rhodothermaceae bacterium]MYC05051.1 type I-E CRISPR-associated endonuclease Cas1 [Rhodothermaceae bacterium]MYE62976.1 type I-E CRISPR-associated endonuclease Cas1 [Rhodothermaceae bacterium]MYI16375.1 type I-E CRISPR-associated endonuclease Cas1 [Rhodothermaceae bacterium]